jgi:hypothetical protein
MKIVNINPGLLPIPPNGWGAIEKIIWEIHQNLLLLGHDSKILYTDEVRKGDFDAVHVHVANLANILHERGIPYIFSFHDHHAYLYGKNSEVFRENYKAMQNSLITLVPAKFLVDYFDLPNVKYFSHGVNTDLFKRNYLNNGDNIKHKLLCVANNGWAYDPKADRKGFSLAIQAAKELGLPLTIAGPKNNKNYFDGGICNNCPVDLVDELYSIAFDISHIESNSGNNKLYDFFNCLINISNSFHTNKSGCIIHKILDSRFKNELVNINQTKDDIFNIYMNGYINSKNIIFNNYIALTY